MPDEKPKPKVKVKQPGSDLRILGSGSFKSKSPAAKKAAPAKKAPAVKKSAR
jgi:hypothetical protein